VRGLSRNGLEGHQIKHRNSESYADGPLVRRAIGLEDFDYLTGDLKRLFEAL
jgi:cystathionine beta-lyase/cystathionine gamma-synthase